MHSEAQTINHDRKEQEQQSIQQLQGNVEENQISNDNDQKQDQTNQISKSLQQQNRKIESSDSQQLQKQILQSQISKYQTLSTFKNSQILNDQVMDQKQQIRQSLKVQIKNDQQNMTEIIKQEYLQNQQLKQEQSYVCQQKIFSEIINPSNKQIILEQQQIQQKPAKQSLSEIIPPKKSQEDERMSNTKVLLKSLTSTTKYIQPNSPELFTTPSSLLPNEVICIDNNSTRIIMHMNKKIVPIPSSFVNNQGNNRGQSSSPQKSKATLPSVQCPYLLGKLVVTNYKLLYMDSLYPNTMTFSLPLNYLYKVQRTIQQSSGVTYLQITFKTGLGIKIKYHQQEFSYSQKIRDITLTLLQRNLYSALDFGQQQNNTSIRCKSYANYFQEVNQKNLIKGIEVDIIDNTQWKQLPGYPEKYMVPLRYISKRNPQSRLVVLSYVYSFQNQKICLYRTGPGNPDPCENEWISKARISQNHHVIQIKNKGIGISKSQAARSVEIQNLYLLRQSYQKVHQLNYHNHDSLKWFANMCNTRWYQQIATIMNEAQYVIQIMSMKTHVTLVCDTQARGAQVSAIVQLLMNPFYRTLEGFPYLIEKQFLHFACPKSSKKQREQDKSVILIQFFDCVYQFTHLYPLSFQFSQNYLVFLAEHVYSNKYGNFLFCTRQLKKEIQRREVVQKCVCIWEDIRRKIQTDRKTFFQMDQTKKIVSKRVTKKASSQAPIHQIINYYIYFRNSFYIDHNESNIFELRNHSQVSKGTKLWTSYFFKRVYACESLKQQVLFCNQIEKRYLKISYEHNMMKKTNQQMRKKLSQQYSKIAQKKQVLKSLKQI